MRKTKDISKYDLEWQLYRISLKRLPSLEAKVQAAVDFLKDHPTQADNERVINYLEGLSMAYRGDVRKKILDVAETLKEEEYTTHNRFDFNPPLLINGNPNKGIKPKYTKAEFDSLAKALIKDLLQRSKGWGSYHHPEHEEFLQKLITYMGDKEAQAKVNELFNIHDGSGGYKGVY